MANLRRLTQNETFCVMSPCKSQSGDSTTFSIGTESICSHASINSLNASIRPAHDSLWMHRVGVIEDRRPSIIIHRRAGLSIRVRTKLIDTEAT